MVSSFFTSTIFSCGLRPTMESSRVYVPSFRFLITKTPFSSVSADLRASFMRTVTYAAGWPSVVFTCPEMVPAGSSTLFIAGDTSSTETVCANPGTDQAKKDIRTNLLTIKSFAQRDKRRGWPTCRIGKNGLRKLEKSPWVAIARHLSKAYNKTSKAKTMLFSTGFYNLAAAYFLTFANIF